MMRARIDLTEKCGMQETRAYLGYLLNYREERTTYSKRNYR